MADISKFYSGLRNPKDTTAAPAPEVLAHYKTHRRELAKMKRAIIEHLELWGILEFGLSVLMHQIMRPDASVVETTTKRLSPKNRGLFSMKAHAAYFSIDGFNGRIKLVDHVFLQFIHETPTFSCILNSWKRIHGKLNDAKSIRNKIAHGSLFGAYLRRKPTIRIGPPLADPSIERNTGLPGLSISEVRKAVTLLKKLETSLRNLIDVIVSYYRDGPDTFRETIPRLEASLKKLPGHRKDGQKRAAP